MFYNRDIFVNHIKLYQLKAKDSEVNAGPLCLGNTSKDFPADNMKTTGLYAYI